MIFDTIRLVYDVSLNTGNTDINLAFNRLFPVVKPYHDAGFTIVFAITHETYGENTTGKWWSDIHKRWMLPNDDRWILLSNELSGMMGNIARQWHDAGISVVWQVWNEPDIDWRKVPDSVPVSAEKYGYMISVVRAEIKKVHDSIQVISAGFNSGPDSGTAFIKKALKTNRTSIDGIAFHPYGRSVKENDKFGMHGLFQESVEKYYAVLNKKVWITEFGIMGARNLNETETYRYAHDMIEYAEQSEKVEAMIWYGWSDRMQQDRETYGVVDLNNNIRQKFASAFSTDRQANGNSEQFGSPIDPHMRSVVEGSWYIEIGHNRVYNPDLVPDNLRGHTHTGLDINHREGDMGRPVYSIADGIVEFSGTGLGTWGQMLIIKHNDGTYARYAHLSQRRVKKDDKIVRGQHIGAIGNAGGKLGPHLHLDMVKTNIWQSNPNHWAGTNTTAIAEHYIDPLAYIEGNAWWKTH